MEHNVGIPVVGGSGAGGGLPFFLPGRHYSITAEQIVDNPVPRPGGTRGLQGLHRGQSSNSVFGADRRISRSRWSSSKFSASPGFRIVFFGFSWTSWVKGVFALFPTGKCEDPAHPGVGTGVRSRAHGRRELSWGLVPWLNTGCVVFSLLLRGKSGALWSAPLVYLLPSGSEQPLAAGCARVLPVSLGGFWKNFLFYVLCVALFALGNLDFAFALISFSPSGVWVLPVEYVVFGTRALLGSTVDSCSTGGFGTNFSIFYVAVNSNSEAVLLHFIIEGSV